MTIWTFLSVLVSSGTAYWIATHVYVRQKEVDSKASHAIEKRAAFAAFFTAAAAVHTELRGALYRGDDPKKHSSEAEKWFHELYSAYEILGLIADEKALNGCREYMFGLSAVRAIVRLKLHKEPLTGHHREMADAGAAMDRLLVARENAIILARADVLSCDETQARKALSGFFERKDISEALMAAETRKG